MVAMATRVDWVYKFQLQAGRQAGRQAIFIIWHPMPSTLFNVSLACYRRGCFCEYRCQSMTCVHVHVVLGVWLMCWALPTSSWAKYVEGYVEDRAQVRLASSHSPKPIWNFAILIDELIRGRRSLDMDLPHSVLFSLNGRQILLRC